MELQDRAAIRAATTARSEALLERGFDPERLVDFIENWPADLRLEVTRILAGELPGLVGGEPGSNSRRMLDAARLSIEEYQAVRNRRGRTEEP
ncbi:MAG: hypothetical protein JNL98_42115 [Bryobacterales bacterium]|nr:hypothetical protein [Bryobacterales bacterium]